jgi:alpha-L-rhamnosidase
MSEHPLATNAAALCQGPEIRHWSGAWIWTDAVEAARNAYAFFRRRFALEAEADLQIFITADSHYELHVDGVRLGRGPARAHLDYYSVDRHEVRLAAGEHVLAVLVHHIGVQNATVMTGRPGVLVEVAGDGTGWGTDAAWRCLPADAWRRDLPCLMSHYGFWEECDLTQLPVGWTTLEFDDSTWMPAVEIGHPPCAPWTRLIAPDIPLPRQADVPLAGIMAGGTWRHGVVDEDTAAKRNAVAGGWLPDASTRDIPSKQAAARRRTRADGALELPLAHAPAHGADAGAWVTLDFGRTVSGYPVVLVEAEAAGAVVDLSYDDIVDAVGAVNPERTYARQTDRYRLAAGRHLLRPVHPRGFRFVTVDLAGEEALTLHAAHALEETYPFPAPAAFQCADPALAGYAPRAAETVRLCTTDAFTDCASRERVQWMEDLYLHARVAAYAFGATALVRRALFQGAQNALADGRINGFMPSERTGCAFAASSLMWLHLLVDYWLFAGDEAACRQLLPTAGRLLELLASQTDDAGLIARWPSGQFWDWAPIEGQGCLLLTNAVYAWALARLGEHTFFAEVFGEGLGAQADRVRMAAHARFWDADRGLYRDAFVTTAQTPIYSQHANALATLAGICPESERAPLLRRLIDPANLGPVPVGEHSLREENRPDPQRLVPVGTLWFGHFLCQALFEAGLASEAIAQMHALWGAYPDSPTFPETRQPGANTTQCHGWAGGPAWLLPAYVLGAHPTGLGWSAVRMAPPMCELASASGSIPTPHGPLQIAWRRESEGIALEVEAPDGVRVSRE